MSAKDETKPHVIVIGRIAFATANSAGVIGLQIAINLLEAGHDVTVLARDHPGDESLEYTSPWAGAQWRTHAGASDIREQKWDIETFRHWTSIVKAEQSANTPLEKRSGVCPVDITNIYTVSSHADLPASQLWFASELPSFNPSPAPSSLPSGVKNITAAWSAPAFTLAVPRYLAHLYQNVKSLGGIFAPRVALPPLSETGSLAATLAHAFALASESRIDGERGCRIFVNATGLGARALVGDNDVFPVRGQVHLVKGAARKATAWHAEGGVLRYVIPRPDEGVTVLGGCREANSWNGREDIKLRGEILEGCKKLAPELLDRKGEFEVLGTQVGLRPARTGGARVEKERVVGLGEDRWLVHAYGHGGAGFQNSIGVAGDVLRLVGECEADGKASNGRARI